MLSSLLTLAQNIHKWSRYIFTKLENPTIWMPSVNIAPMSVSEDELFAARSGMCLRQSPAPI